MTAQNVEDGKCATCEHPASQHGAPFSTDATCQVEECGCFGFDAEAPTETLWAVLVTEHIRTRGRYRGGPSQRYLVKATSGSHAVEVLKRERVTALVNAKAVEAYPWDSNVHMLDTCLLTPEAAERAYQRNGIGIDRKEPAT